MNMHVASVIVLVRVTRSFYLVNLIFSVIVSLLEPEKCFDNVSSNYYQYQCKNRDIRELVIP